MRILYAELFVNIFIFAKKCYENLGSMISPNQFCQLLGDINRADSCWLIVIKMPWWACDDHKWSINRSEFKLNG